MRRKDPRSRWREVNGIGISESNEPTCLVSAGRDFAQATLEEAPLAVIADEAESEFIALGRFTVGAESA